MHRHDCRVDISIYKRSNPGKDSLIYNLLCVIPDFEASSSTILTTTFPQVSRLPNAFNARGTLSRPTKLSSLKAVPRNLPWDIKSKIPRHTVSTVSFSNLAYWPQCNPTRLTFFSRTRFSATFSIFPAANPMTSSRAFQATHFRLCRSSPRGHRQCPLRPCRCPSGAPRTAS